MPNNGPYETERQALAEPMPREINALRDADRIPAGDPGRLVGSTVLRHVEQACAEAGVVLGTYDRRILAWLAGWSEPANSQVVIGLIRRAYAAGREAAAEAHDQALAVEAQIIENIRRGYVEFAGVSDDGQLTFRMTEAGRRHVEEMIGDEPDEGGDTRA